jgi:hypothetical protein
MAEEWVFYMHPDGSPGTGEATAYTVARHDCDTYWIVERKTDKSFHQGKGIALLKALEEFNWVWTRRDHEPLLLGDLLIDKKDQEQAMKEVGGEIRSWGGAFTSKGTED